MRKNQGYRAAGMRARTNTTGSKLAITYGKRSVTLSEAAAEELLKWLISVFDFEERVKEVALGDLGGVIHRIRDCARLLENLFSTPVWLSAAAAQATLETAVKATVQAQQNRARIEAESKRPAARKKRRARGTRKPK